MKRDFDLIRMLMLKAEGDDSVDLTGFTEDQIKYHQALLIEAGLLEGAVKNSSRSYTEIPDQVVVRKLTWNGHEFLDLARRPTIWSLAKELLSKKGIELSFDVLKDAMGIIIKGMMQ